MRGYKNFDGNPHPGDLRHLVEIGYTEDANRIRSAMYAAGFFMVEESDKGYNQPAYDTATRQYTVQWTWCLYQEVTGDAP